VSSATTNETKVWRLKAGLTPFAWSFHHVNLQGLSFLSTDLATGFSTVVHKAVRKLDCPTACLISVLDGPLLN
jgi:hypothetical protein